MLISDGVLLQLLIADGVAPCFSPVADIRLCRRGWSGTAKGGQRPEICIHIIHTEHICNENFDQNPCDHHQDHHNHNHRGNNQPETLPPCTGSSSCSLKLCKLSPLLSQLRKLLLIIIIVIGKSFENHDNHHLRSIF